MNTVRIPRLLKYAVLLVTLLGSNLLLSACGGDDDKSNTSSSASSSSVSSRAFSSTPVTPPMSGTWPDVKVSASGTKALKFDWTAAPNASYYKLYKKVDANSAYVQVGADFTANTISDPISVHLTDWVNSRYKVQACTAADVCDADSKEIIIDSAMLAAITYIKASNTDAGDWFGWSIALSGDGKTLAVGAPAEASNAIGVNGDQTSNTSPTSGAVYVFVKVDGNWVQEAYLKASNTEQPNSNSSLTLPNDRFGYQVSLSADGNTLAVSAINEDSISSGINCNEANYTISSTYSSNSSTYTVVQHVNTDFGAVYIFKRNSASWTQTAFIKPFNPLAAPNFGSHIILSGDGKTLAVGNEFDSFETSGIVMASGSTSSIGCIEYYPSSSSKSSNSSSSSVQSSSSSKNTIGGNASGAVYIYKETESGWVEDARIKASDTSQGDTFGASIDLSYSGNTLAVGAVRAEEMVLNSSSSSVKARMILKIDGIDYASRDNLNSGAVYIYNRAESWQESSKIIPVNQGWEQLFGFSLSLSDDGKTLAVGVPGDWSLAAGTTGSPTNYTTEGGIGYDKTSRFYYIDPKLNITRDKSSYASGAAYIYKYSDITNTWVQEGYLKASNPQSGYQFGSSLSLSGNGDVLAVGSYIEASLATGINGDQLDRSSPDSGATYIFKRSASTWTQQSYVKAPNNHEDDRFSRALSLDFTGDILAVGAHRESSKATGINGDKTNTYDKAFNAPAHASGAVYIY